MQTLGILVAVAVLVGGASVVTPAAGADGCRQQWTDLASLHSENGNPEGSATVLVERWNATYEQAWQLAETATPADCGVVAEVPEHDDLGHGENAAGGLVCLRFGPQPQPIGPRTCGL